MTELVVSLMQPPTVPTPDADFLRARKQQADDTDTSSRPGTKPMRLFKVTPLTQKSSLLQLMTKPVNNVLIYPKDFYKASNELITLTLVVCWIVTFIFNPDSAINHPSRDYIPHFNPCFGWDFPPASYIAVLFNAFDVYLSWTYVNYEMIRTRILDRDGTTTVFERFAAFSAGLHGVNTLLWMLLWSIGPPDGRWGWHLGIFSIAVFFRYICALGNYLEQRFGTFRQREHVKTRHTVFIIVYGSIVASLPCLYFYCMLVYQWEGRTGRDPPLPFWLLQTVDLSWMACLVLSTRLAVPEPPLRIRREVLLFDQEYVAAEEDVHGGDERCKMLADDERS